MTEIQRIRNELALAHDGAPWHGPSARQVLSGVTAAQAAARPIPGAHSIWELVLHIIAWRGEVARRLKGGEPALPAEGDWPGVAASSEGAWADALRRLEESHRCLAAAVSGFPEARLDQPVGLEPDPALGTVGSFYVMLHGISQHDAYHSGQISLLKKALATG